MLLPPHHNRDGVMWVLHMTLTLEVDYESMAYTKPQWVLSRLSENLYMFQQVNSNISILS